MILRAVIKIPSTKIPQKGQLISSKNELSGIVVEFSRTLSILNAFLTFKSEHRLHFFIGECIKANIIELKCVKIVSSQYQASLRDVHLNNNIPSIHTMIPAINNKFNSLQIYPISWTFLVIKYFLCLCLYYLHSNMHKLVQFQWRFFIYYFF